MIMQVALYYSCDGDYFERNKHQVDAVKTWERGEHF